MVTVTWSLAIPKESCTRWRPFNNFKTPSLKNPKLESRANLGDHSLRSSLRFRFTCLSINQLPSGFTLIRRFLYFISQVQRLSCMTDFLKKIALFLTCRIKVGSCILLLYIPVALVWFFLYYEYFGSFLARLALFLCH